MNRMESIKELDEVHLETLNGIAEMQGVNMLAEATLEQARRYGDEEITEKAKALRDHIKEHHEKFMQEEVRE